MSDGGDTQLVEPVKTPGQVAYEADRVARPVYPGGHVVRPPWEKLSRIVKLSWEKNPTPRWR